MTSDSYNNRLWPSSTTDANSGTTQYGYDAHGNRTSLKDSVNNQTTWTYSAINQVLTDTNQLGFARTYVYNASGDLTQETDRNGLVRQCTYGAGNGDILLFAKCRTVIAMVNATPSPRRQTACAPNGPQRPGPPVYL